MAYKYIIGTNNNETLQGSAGADAMHGLDGNDFLFGYAGDDILIGGNGNDGLFGGAGNDVLGGDEGNDTLNGGDGVDTANYSFSPDRVLINLAQNTAHGGYAEGDILVSIENVIGTAGNDFISGDLKANRLEGHDGIDRLDGGEGDDILLGGKGDDNLAGGFGADVLDGGDGADTASYVVSKFAVVVDLLSGKAYGGDADGDTLIDIENLTGSKFDDALVGNDKDNVLRGNHGVDELVGGKGSDAFDFGRFMYKWESGLGADADRVSDFSQADGDIIDVSRVGLGKFGDSITFTFIGESDFGGKGAEARYEQIGSDTWLSFDSDGDAKPEFQVVCTGLINFTMNDFDL